MGERQKGGGGSCWALGLLFLQFSSVSCQQSLPCPGKTGSLFGIFKEESQGGHNSDGSPFHCYHSSALSSASSFIFYLFLETREAKQGQRPRKWPQSPPISSFPSSSLWVAPVSHTAQGTGRLQPTAGTSFPGHCLLPPHYPKLSRSGPHAGGRVTACLTGRSRGQ